MKYGLKEETINKIQQVFLSVPEIEEVILYDSRAKGNFKNGSDIDIAVMGSDVNSKVINRLSWLLDDLLLPYTFDIVIYKHIDDNELQEHIKGAGCKLYPVVG